MHTRANRACLSLCRPSRAQRARALLTLNLANITPILVAGDQHTDRVRFGRDMGVAVVVSTGRPAEASVLSPICCSAGTFACSAQL